MNCAPVQLLGVAVLAVMLGVVCGLIVFVLLRAARSQP